MPSVANLNRAVGVIAGTFIPERRLLVTPQGQSYKANGLPSVVRRYRDKPELFAKCDLHLVFPRTVRGSLEFIVARSSGPSDPERYASMKREEGQFRIAGVVTNQRSRHNRVVLRVCRNAPAPTGRKRQTEFKPHLLFLQGRLAPAKDFQNTFCNITATISGDGKTLQIRRVESKKKIQVEPMEAGGIVFPWPFYAGRQALESLLEFNPALGTGPFLVRPPVEDALAPGLAKLESLIASRKKAQESPEESLITDRLVLVARRLSSYIGRMGLLELQDLLEELGTHTILRRIELEAPKDAPSAPAPAPAPAPVATPEPQPESPLTALPEDLMPLAGLLIEGLPDSILRDEIGDAALKRGVGVLAECGWFDGLSAAEQKLALRSYQMKKALKRRG